MSRAPVQSRPSLPTSDGLESSHPTCDAESQKEGTARLEGEAARLGELFPYASPLTAGCGVSPALEDQVRSSSNLASVERTWAHRANCGPSQSRTFHQALCFRWHHKGRKEWLLLSEDSSVYFVRIQKHLSPDCLIEARPAPRALQEVFKTKGTLELDASSILSIQDRWLPFPRTRHEVEVMGWNVTTASAIEVQKAKPLHGRVASRSPVELCWVFHASPLPTRSGSDCFAGSSWDLLVCLLHCSRCTLPVPC